MKFEQSHYLLRTVMPAVKSKATFAVIAAVADATWGWNGREEVVLSINDLAEATGLSHSGVRKCLNDDDFSRYVSRSLVDESNVTSGYTYKMLDYVTEEHSTMSPRSIVPYTEEHSTPTQSNIATSGPKEKKENIKEEKKAPAPEPSQPTKPAKILPAGGINEILVNNGLSQEVEPEVRELYEAMRNHCQPVKANTRWHNAAEAYRMGIRAEHIKGVSNGYWTENVGGRKPYPSQIADHYEAYIEWTEHRTDDMSVDDIWTKFIVPAMHDQTRIREWPQDKKDLLRVIGGQRVFNEPEGVIKNKLRTALQGATA